MDDALKLLWEARNDLSDVINTWARGAAVPPPVTLCNALDQIDGKLLAVLASIEAFRVAGYVVK
jgi:hypothetical protein